MVQSSRERPSRPSRPLSTEYHRARKQVLLWAGILFIWELVGIDLDKAKETGGNAGAIISAIKSPQALPWVLLALVAYFLFKLWVEWSQCEDGRKKVRAARIDYASAWLVAVLASILYLYQALSRVQVADALQGSKRWQSALSGLVAGILLDVGTERFFFFRSGSSKRERLLGLTVTLFVIFFTAEAMPIFGTLVWVPFAGGATIGAAIVELSRAYLYRITSQKVAAWDGEQ